MLKFCVFKLINWQKNYPQLFFCIYSRLSKCNIWVVKLLISPFAHIFSLCGESATIDNNSQTLPSRGIPRTSWHGESYPAKDTDEEHGESKETNHRTNHDNFRKLTIIGHSLDERCLRVPASLLYHWPGQTLSGLWVTDTRDKRGFSTAEFT